MKRLALLILLLAAAFPPVALAQENEAIPASDYWRRLEGIRQQLEDIADLPPEQAGAKLEAILGDLGGMERVRLADGIEVQVSHAHLIRLLEMPEPAIQPAAALIQTTLDGKDSLAGRSFGAEEVAALNRILAQPEFNWPEVRPNPIQQFLQRALDAFFRFLDRIFPDGRIGVNGGGLLQVFATVLAAVLIGVVLYQIVRGSLTTVVSDTDLDLSGEHHEPLNAASAYNRATELSTTGDYRTAVRYLYLSALLILEERNLLRYNRSLTNREYVGSIGGHPHLQKQLVEIVEVFDRVWYGFQPLEKPAFEAFAGRVRRLREDSP